MPNAIVGIEDHLLEPLQKAIEKAQRIRIISAFIMESGARCLSSLLLDAAQRGVPIEILTGRYMSITEPSALFHLKDRLGDLMDLRFYTDNARSFHPKAYIIDYADDGDIFVGSSNISLSAFTVGVEWNYRLSRSRSPEDYLRFASTFNELFTNHAETISDQVLREYAINWKKPGFVRHEQASEQLLYPASPMVEPRGAQIEALYELKRAREEGVSRGLVVAATGVGKTFLAAFDSTAFKRVLFIAHREEILLQARDSFSKVRPLSSSGLLYGSNRPRKCDLCFASVQTLSRPGNIKAFPPDYFDYVVVDEFHHAAAASYKRVLDYFKPRFLLGLTATPFRTDNQDIYRLCDDNLIYEIYLRDAINRDLLVPFDYYAVYDPTDYEGLPVRNGRYVVDALEQRLSLKDRADLVLSNFRKLAGLRTLGFCASVKHADYMASYFNHHGVSSVAVHSQAETSGDRHLAIQSIIDGTVQVIFAIDIFNEGVDLPSIDTVMFLRPTESMTVFLQQLGRGMRKHEEKERLTVIDFIGNYKKAHYLPVLLAGGNPMDSMHVKLRRIKEYKYPEGCQAHFDFRVIDLFEQLARRDPLPVRKREDYFRLKEYLGHRPSRVEMMEGSDIPIREFLSGGWLGFLASLGELEADEECLLGTRAEKFLEETEKTSMTKSYKVPTIAAFIEKGSLLMNISLERVGRSLMDFYTSSPVHQRDLRDQTNQSWADWQADDFARLARLNPVRFLSRGKHGFYHYDEINRVFMLDSELGQYPSDILAWHLADILEYKRLSYFRRKYRNEDEKK